MARLRGMSCGQGRGWRGRQDQIANSHGDSGLGHLKSPGKVLIDGVSRKKIELLQELSGGLQAKVCNCSLRRLKEDLGVGCKGPGLTS